MDVAPAAGHEVSSASLGVAVSLLVALGSAAFSLIRYRRDTGLTRRSERAVRTLLKWNRFRLPWSCLPQPFVAFRVLRYHIGGYSDNELRQILVRCGALRFSDNNWVEYWALVVNLTRGQKGSIHFLRAPLLPITPISELSFADDKGMPQ